MASTKEQMIKIIENQPENSTYDEILRELALARMIERGLVDSDNKRIISTAEVQRRIRTWQSSIGLMKP